MDFYDLDLSDPILDALDDMNFTECTPIQEHAIPVILEGRDLIGVAQTGTGKTAAYLLPILSKLSDGDYPSNVINCIIMSPTRELAQQIDQAMEGFSYHVPVSSVAVYGGNDGIRYEQEKRGLSMGADVIIATPGRLISHLSLGNVDLSHVSFFILDEADRMLDMGFSDDIMQIVKHLPENRQTIMFSATMPTKIQELAKTILHNPAEVKLAVSKPAEKIVQSAYVCYEAQKVRLVKEIFRDRKPERVIIFASSKLKVKDINITLQRAGFNAGAMHSDLEQAERDDVMYRFKTQQIDILVATDIVARGIDIDDIQLVINFDVPHDAEDYVHRIGRTARANHDGEAITFVGEKDQIRFAAIERFLEKDIEKRPLPEGLGEAPSYQKDCSSRRSSGSKGKSSRRRGSAGNNEGNKKTGTDNRLRRNRNKRQNGKQQTTSTPVETASTISEAKVIQPVDNEKKKRRRPHHHANRRRSKSNSENNEGQVTASEA
ncbi:MAG: DEAD/DEAH box helicase [Clostridium sp.]|nr:DEAD/DEAH box helicase [Clostridium sp.]